MVVALYLIGINVVAYVIMIWDKRAARLQKQRIPETRMFWIAFIGGALGIWTGMKHVRHKTQKRKFMLGIPLIIVLNMLMVGVGVYIWG